MTRLLQKIKTLSGKRNGFSKYQAQRDVFFYPTEMVWRRFFAAITDFYVFSYLFQLIMISLLQLNLTEESKIGSTALAVTAAFILTYVGSRIFLNKQTIGMWLFEWENVDSQKLKKLSVVREGFRLISQIFNIIPLFLPYLIILFNKSNIHISDMISGSKPITSRRISPLNRNIYQKFIGIFLFQVSIGYILTLASKDVAIELFGQIHSGTTAYFIIIALLIFSLPACYTNLSGNRLFIAFSLPFFLIQTSSPIYVLFHFKNYIKMLINQVNKLTTAIQSAGSGIEASTIAAFIQQSKESIHTTALPITLYVLSVNLVLCGYFVFKLIEVIKSKRRETAK